MGLPGPRAALLGVAMLYLLGQLLVLEWNRYLEADEAVYLSQVAPGPVPATWDAHRSLGVPLLLLPAAAVTTEQAALRLYLVGASALALALAFSPWLRLVRGYAARLAAMLFAGSWVALFYGGEASPNLYAALGAVGGLGCLGQLLWRSGGWRAALGLAVVALMRPFDCPWLAGSGAAAVLLPGARDRLRAGLAVGSGLGAVAGRSGHRLRWRGRPPRAGPGALPLRQRHQPAAAPARPRRPDGLLLRLLPAAAGVGRRAGLVDRPGGPGGPGADAGAARCGAPGDRPRPSHPARPQPPSTCSSARLAFRATCCRRTRC